MVLFMEVILDGNIIDRVWRLGPTAESLGISKKTLQRLVARRLRTAHALDACSDRLDRATALLAK